MTQMSPGSAPTTTAAVEMLANGQLLAGDLETAATGPGRRATTSGRRAARYFLRRVVANVLVVLPISLLFIALIAGVFGQGINPAAGGLLGFGLVAAVLGLTAFTEGLRLSVMVPVETVERDA